MEGSVFIFDQFFYNKNLTSFESQFLVRGRHPLTPSPGRHPLNSGSEEERSLNSDSGSGTPENPPKPPEFQENPVPSAASYEFVGEDDSDPETGYVRQKESSGKKKKKTLQGKYRKKAVATLFGRTSSGVPVAIHVINLETYFCIKVSEKYSQNPQEFLKKFKYQLYLPGNFLEIPVKHKNYELSLEIVYWIDADGFTNNTMEPFLKLTFKNFGTRNRYFNYLKKLDKIGDLPLKLYEGKCYPYMRFLHDQNLDPVSWITLKNFINLPEGEKVTRCPIEVLVRYEDLEPVQKPPLPPPLSVLAFDIETAPLISGALHPVLSRGDPIIAMPVSFKIGEKYYNYVPIFLSHSKIPEDVQTPYIPIPCKTEEELIRTFIKFLREGPSAFDSGAPKGQIPDITLSFNGNGYDWEYIVTRAKALDIFEDLQKSSKFLDYPSKIDERHLESSGLGKNDVYYLDLPGIINIDLLPYFKKQNSVELPDLKLDTIAKHYLTIKEEKITFLNYLDILVKILKSSNPSQSLREEAKSLEEIKEKTGVFLEKIVKLSGGLEKVQEMAGNPDGTLNYVLLSKIIYEGYQHKTSSEKAKYDLPYETMYQYMAEALKLHEEDPVGNLDEINRRMDEIAKYSIQDCILLHKLDTNRTVILNTYSNANISSITWKTVFKCGSGVPIYSVVLKYAKQRNKKVLVDCFFDQEEYDDLFETAVRNVPEYRDRYAKLHDDYEGKSLETKIKKFKKEFYEFGVISGGYVKDPESGIHHNVATFDVNSEYPSIMMTHNLSMDTLVKDDRYRGLPGFTYNDIEWETVDGKKHTTTFVCDYKNRKYEDQGLLPQVLEYYVGRRKEVRAIQKKLIDGSPEWLTLEAEQLAIKILCNSVYGTTVDKKSRLSCIAIGGCTTAKSREYIIECADLVRQWFTNVTIVYGDTDSFFARFDYPGMTKEEAFQAAWNDSKKVEGLLNNYMQNERAVTYKYMKIEFEKIFSLLYLFDKKKKYFGKKHECPDLTIFKPICMGVKYKKRDSSGIEKFVGTVVQELVMNEKLDLIIPFIQGCFVEIKKGKFENNYFKKSCKYNPPYANPKGTMGHVIYEIIKDLDEGNTPQKDQRMFYTYCKFPENAGRSRYKVKKTEIAYPFDYLTKEHKIDYSYYVEFFLNNIETILKTIDSDKFQVLKQKVKTYF